VLQPEFQAPFDHLINRWKIRFYRCPSERPSFFAVVQKRSLILKKLEPLRNSSRRTPVRASHGRAVLRLRHSGALTLLALKEIRTQKHRTVEIHLDL